MVKLLVSEAVKAEGWEMNNNFLLVVEANTKSSLQPIKKINCIKKALDKASFTLLHLASCMPSFVLE